MWWRPDVAPRLSSRGERSDSPGSRNSDSIEGNANGTSASRWSWIPGSPSAPRDDSAGFTLIECLVSFAVLALLLGVMFRGVVELRAGAITVDVRAQADLVAHSILEEALAKRDLRNGTTSGLRDGRRWTLEAKPVDLAAQLPHREDPDPKPQADPRAPSDPKGQAAPPPPDWKPQRLTVRVETGGRPVSVEAIRLAKAS